MMAADAGQMKELDSKAIASGISIRRLMAEAGKRVAEQAALMGRKIVIVAGKGNNGGDGIAAAGFLLEENFEVEVVLAFPENKLKEDGKFYLEKFKSLGGKVYFFDEMEGREVEQLLSRAEVIVDSLLGFGLQSHPKEPVAGLIRMVNAAGKKVLAVDVPSGLDASTGKAFTPCVKAVCTITLAVMKKGLLEKEAGQYTGRVFLADIGFPEEIYAEFGLDKKELFKGKKIARLNQ